DPDPVVESLAFHPAAPVLVWMSATEHTQPSHLSSSFIPAIPHEGNGNYGQVRGNHKDE
ncbi:Hypothetical predicted protein, partial [Marmota monax]